MLIVSTSVALRFRTHGATQATLADDETSTGNTFATGSLDLKVGGFDDPDVVHVTLNDMKPGDTASYQWVLSNTGSIAGKPWIEIVNVKNNDNGCVEPETNVPDSTCGNPGLGDGELGDYLMMKLNAPGGVGYVYPNDVPCTTGNQCPLNHWSSLGHIDEVIDGQVWDTIAGGSSLAPMVLEFEIPSTVDDIIQTDSVEFDIVFHLEQAP